MGATVRNKKPLRVLISRLSAIGDAVLTMPLACAIKDHDPDAFVAWVAEPAAAEMLRGHACIDELITVRKGWLKSPATVRDLRQQLRALQCDVAIDPQSLTKSSLTGWLSGARQRIGFDASQGRELALWLNRSKLPRAKDHLVDAQLQLLAPLGIEDPVARFDVPHDAAADAVARTYIQAAGLAEGFAMINPGAGWDSRLWPVARFATVARYLGQEHGLPTVVVWAGGKEHHFAESIVDGSGGYASMAPDTSLRELTAITRQARMFVSADTGPLHIAAATGVPCVGLYGVTDAEHSGPYGDQHRVLQGPFQEMSSRKRRATTNDAMRAITAEQACEACDQLLQATAKETYCVV